MVLATLSVLQAVAAAESRSIAIADTIHLRDGAVVGLFHYDNDKRRLLFTERGWRRSDVAAVCSDTGRDPDVELRRKAFEHIASVPNDGRALGDIVACVNYSPDALGQPDAVPPRRLAVQYVTSAQLSLLFDTPPLAGDVLVSRFAAPPGPWSLVHCVYASGRMLSTERRVNAHDIIDDTVPVEHRTATSGNDGHSSPVPVTHGAVQRLTKLCVDIEACLNTAAAEPVTRHLRLGLYFHTTATTAHLGSGRWLLFGASDAPAVVPPRDVTPAVGAQDESVSWAAQGRSPPGRRSQAPGDGRRRVKLSPLRTGAPTRDEVLARKLLRRSKSTSPHGAAGGQSGAVLGGVALTFDPAEYEEHMAAGTTHGYVVPPPGAVAAAISAPQSSHASPDVSPCVDAPPQNVFSRLNPTYDAPALRPSPSPTRKANAVPPLVQAGVVLNRSVVRVHKEQCVSTGMLKCLQRDPVPARAVVRTTAVEVRESFLDRMLAAVDRRERRDDQRRAHLLAEAEAAEASAAASLRSPTRKLSSSLASQELLSAVPRASRVSIRKVEDATAAKRAELLDRYDPRRFITALNDALYSCYADGLSGAHLTERDHLLPAPVTIDAERLPDFAAFAEELSIPLHLPGGPPPEVSGAACVVPEENADDVVVFLPRRHCDAAKIRHRAERRAEELLGHLQRLTVAEVEHIQHDVAESDDKHYHPVVAASFFDKADADNAAVAVVQRLQGIPT